MDDVDRLLAALRESHARLRGHVVPLDADGVTQLSYASEWTIAQVLSHIGSHAELAVAGLDAALDGREPDDPQPVWDRWNSKAPRAQQVDALTADAAFLSHVEGLTPEERAATAVSLGPMLVDLPSFLRLRLGEHVLHTWDVGVALDPTATLPAGHAELLLGVTTVVTNFAVRPTGVERTVTVRTTDTGTTFTFELTPAATTMHQGGDGPPDVEMPAEAFVRLVYGRLDPEHSPAGLEHDPTVELLRSALPGL